MSEEWRDIPGFEGLYQVSNCGSVKRLAGSPRCVSDRILLPFADKDGYRQAALSKFGNVKIYKVHRLVLLAFVGDSHLPVNHKERRR